MPSLVVCVNPLHPGQWVSHGGILFGQRERRRSVHACRGNRNGRRKTLEKIETRCRIPRNGRIMPTSIRHARGRTSVIAAEEEFPV